MVKKKISIASIVTTLLIGTSLLLTLTILIIVKNESDNAAIDAAEDYFEEIVQKTEAKLDILIEPVIALSEISAASFNADMNTGTREDLQRSLMKMAAILEANEDLMSAYVGFNGGAFYQLIATRGNEFLLNRYQAPPKCAYIDRAVMVDGSQCWRFFDVGLNELGSRVESGSYDPRVRPWYEMAFQMKRSIFTPPYIFSSSRIPGITCAKVLDDGSGVVGLDISLARLSEILARQRLTPNGKIWIVDSENRLIAYPGEGMQRVQGNQLNFPKADKCQYPPVRSVADMGKCGTSCSTRETFFFDVEGNEFMASLTPMPEESGLSLVIAAAAPVSDITSHFSHMSQGIVTGAMAVMFFLTLFSFWIGRRASGIVRSLVREARKVQQFDFSASEPLRSGVKEIHELGVAGSLMKSTIRDRTASLIATQEKLRKLVDAGLALTAEKDFSRLVSLIFDSARDLVKAEGGVVYLREGDKLAVELLSLNSSSFVMGGLSDDPAPRVMVIPSIMNFLQRDSVLHHACDAFNQRRVVTVENGELSLFPTGMEEEHGEVHIYSAISAPIITRGDEVLGVIQLFNVDREEMQEIEVSRTWEMSGLLGSLVSQAAVGLDNRYLVESLEEMLDSVIKVIAASIDAKSPYTAGHCTRVPEIAEMLVEAVHRTDNGPMRDFKMEDDDQRRQMWLAGWLHDCGKVSNPEYVVDKATKLETIHDRIHEVRTRFEVLRRDAEIACLNGILEGGNEQQLRRELDEELSRLDDDFDFIAKCNIGGEFMTGEDMARVREIAERTWHRHYCERKGVGHMEAARMGIAGEDGKSAEVLPVQEKLLSDKAVHVIPRGRSYDHITDIHGDPIEVPDCEYNRGEVYNLCVERGTLTPEERFKVNEHMLAGLDMLERIPFPKRFSRVTPIATGHHETLNGTGYPLKRDRNTLCVESRVLAIADIFEALTAADRPYKKAKTLSEALSIMSSMCEKEHIDSDIFEIFLREGIYREYAEKYLPAEQLDVDDISPFLPGGAG